MSFNFATHLGDLGPRPTWSDQVPSRIAQLVFSFTSIMLVASHATTSTVIGDGCVVLPLVGPVIRSGQHTHTPR